jgi:2-methylfumaryl-CoA isomerase
MTLALPILSGLRIIEGSAFVAAPLGGLTLAQLGAEVIRFDPLAGGLDFKRWPITKSQASLFWAGLNRGKKSIQVDLKSEKGRRLVSDLITAPGEGSGIFLTNLASKDLLSYEELRKKRSDVIMISLTGNFDGSSEVDYTVQPAFGYPVITGPKNSNSPINSVLPTWDLILGNLVAIAILAAERKRRQTGEGELVSIALSDVALSIVGALGRLSQAYIGEETIAPDGNYLYGSFGKNFLTADNQQIMLVGLTSRQWNSLKIALGIESSLKELEKTVSADFQDEGQRYLHRESIALIIEKTVASKTLEDLIPTFEANKVSWSKYQSFEDLLNSDARASDQNPIFSLQNQPGIGITPNIASPIRFQFSRNLEPEIAPHFGQHTEQVLKEILHLTPQEIDGLVNEKIIERDNRG